MISSMLTRELVAAEKAVERAQDALDRNEKERAGLIAVLSNAQNERDSIESTLKGLVAK